MRQAPPRAGRAPFRSSYGNASRVPCLALASASDKGKMGHRRAARRPAGRGDFCWATETCASPVVTENQRRHAAERTLRLPRPNASVTVNTKGLRENQEEIKHRVPDEAAGFPPSRQRAGATRGSSPQGGGSAGRDPPQPVPERRWRARGRPWGPPRRAALPA